jgi:cyclopropane fatty-acyl-phospholipid synthase-like methyltransferase
MDAMGKQDELEAAKAELAAIRAELGNVGLLSHGYVQDRGPGAGGPCYQWTRKVKAKTVSVALSKEQFAAMKEAISNWKELKARLARMEELSRLIIFATTPDTRRSKRPTKATLGLGKRPKSP